MTYYLVEKHTTVTGTNETIPWHTIVNAKSHINAFIIAERKHANLPEPYRFGFVSVTERMDRGLWSFHYAPEELEEVVPNYLWAASDGSDVWYEVRCLGELS